MAWQNPQWKAYVDREKDALVAKGKPEGTRAPKKVSEAASMAYLQACVALPRNSRGEVTNIGIQRYLRVNGPVTLGPVTIERFVMDTDKRGDNPYYDVRVNGQFKLTTGVFEMALAKAADLAVIAFDKQYPLED